MLVELVENADLFIKQMHFEMRTLLKCLTHLGSCIHEKTEAKDPRQLMICVEDM